MVGHFSNHLLNRYILVLLPCRVMCQNWTCFFNLIVFLLIYSAVNLFYIQNFCKVIWWDGVLRIIVLQLQAVNFFHTELYLKCFGGPWSFLKKIGIHSMQDWRATTRLGITRKRNTKRLRLTGNLFRKNLQLKDVC